MMYCIYMRLVQCYTPVSCDLSTNLGACFSFQPASDWLVVVGVYISFAVSWRLPRNLISGNVHRLCAADISVAILPYFFAVWLGSFTFSLSLSLSLTPSLPRSLPLSLSHSLSLSLSLSFSLSHTHTHTHTHTHAHTQFPLLTPATR